jgi:pyruvate formate lyase activating enzyme
VSQGIIFSIREFTLHDGPGIRTTVFFKGCPLRCQWCHNPEGLSPEPELMIKSQMCTGCGKCMRGCAHEVCQPFERCTRICPNNCVEICGERIEAGALAQRLLKNRMFFEDGGITVSGGEPLMQPEFLMELLTALRPVHRAIETSGHADWQVFRRAAEEADLILMDLKLMDPARHKAYTGVDNARILRNLEVLKAVGKPFVARIPLIPGVNDSAENMEQTAAALEDCRDRVKVEVLPYNQLAGAKYASVGRSYGFSLDPSKAGPWDTRPFERRGIDIAVY